LLIEDNRADALLVQEAIELHELPIELHVVEDGEQAFQFMERADADPEAPCPDIVLLDLNLPKRHGKEVLRRVRGSSRCGNVPVLIITSSNLSTERDELAKLGANRYFRKPFAYDQFMKVGEVLKEILNDSKVQ
jgi:CheY-like chemotaxis protein